MNKLLSIQNENDEIVRKLERKMIFQAVIMITWNGKSKMVNILP